MPRGQPYGWLKRFNPPAGRGAEYVIWNFWPLWGGLPTANDTRSYYTVIRRRVGQAGCDAYVEYKADFRLVAGGGQLGSA